MSLGEGFGVGLRGVEGGAVFLWKAREKGKGVGRVGRWGGDRQRNRQVNAQALSKLRFSDLPFSLPPRSDNCGWRLIDEMRFHDLLEVGWEVAQVSFSPVWSRMP